MKTRYLAATAAAALLLGALAPVTAASAADSSITGVITGVDGPLSDAIVGWVDADDPSNESFANTGEDGTYTLDIPADLGDYYLFTNLYLDGDGGGTTANPDYTSEFFGEDGERGFVAQAVSPYSAPLTGELDIELIEAGSISGTSVIYAGQNLTLQTLGKTYVTDTQVDDDGAFSFDGLAPGKYLVTADRTGKYVSYTSGEVSVESGTTTDLTITPKAGAKIAGVVKAGGEPVKGITVYLSSDLDGGFATTSSTGSYSVAGLIPGKYSVSFLSFSTTLSKTYVRKTVSGKKATAATTTTVNVSLARAGQVTGKIKKNSGARYYEVYVYDSKKRYAGYYSATVSQKFSIGSLGAGKYTAYFVDDAHKYYGMKSFTIKAGKSTSLSTQKLSKKTVSLTGTVSGATAGYVEAYRSSLPGGFSEISSSGKYSIKGLVPGKYSVLSVPVGFTGTSVSLTISKSTKKALSKGTAHGKYTGTVLANGVPLEGAQGAYLVGRNYWDFGIENGALSGTAEAGTARLEFLYLQTVTFPGNTPYWYDFPAAAKSFTLKSGKTTALGTFELELKGGPQPPVG